MNRPTFRFPERLSANLAGQLLRRLPNFAYERGEPTILCNDHGRKGESSIRCAAFSAEPCGQTPEDGFPGNLEGRGRLVPLWSK